jgi:phosphoglycerate dehydrogenase-like enzyme
MTTDSLSAVSPRSLTQLKVFLLTHPRAQEDAPALAKSFPGIRFVAATEGWQKLAAEADALFLGRGVAIDEVLERAPRLRWIHNGGAGVDRILTPRMRQSDVILTNSSGVHSVAIPEHVLALMFAFARQLPELGRAQAARQWRRPTGKFFELEGQMLAVIGLGAIGRSLARKAHALGLRVVGVRRGDLESPVEGVERVYGTAQIDAAIAEAHHVAICLPLTDATRGWFNDERFAHIREGAYLYNIGRGAIVDPSALDRALASGRIAGAGLDVTSPEPLPADSPLWSNPSVIITNHTSGGSPKNVGRVLDLVRENISRALEGRPLRNVVDKQRGY